MLKLRLVRHCPCFSVEDIKEPEKLGNCLRSLPSLMADIGRNSITSVLNLQTLSVFQFPSRVIVVSDTGLLCCFSLSAAL